MKVNPSKPFEFVYSLFEHQYLGYMFESFAIQLSDTGEKTLTFQNVSSKNAQEFKNGLDETDFKLIYIMDETEQENVIKKFYNKKISTVDFFNKFFDSEKGDKEIQKLLINYQQLKMAQILELLQNGKNIYTMGNDGYPAGKKLFFVKEPATITFHFKRNDYNTLYHPIIKEQGGRRIYITDPESKVICNEPAFLISNGDKIYCFEDDIDGKKLVPFLKKEHIMVPRTVEDNYFKKFVAPLISQFEVVADGLLIKQEKYALVPIIQFYELKNTTVPVGLFDDGTEIVDDDSKIVFELIFSYGTYTFKSDTIKEANVVVTPKDGTYEFHKVVRKNADEKAKISYLNEIGLPIKNGKTTLNKVLAFDWISKNLNTLRENGFNVSQKDADGKKYFLGKSTFEVEISENIDWFDVKALAYFGEFAIPFSKIKKYIDRNIREFELPNGEIAVIPDEWFVNYSEFFAFLEGEEEFLLKKHHLALIKELEEGNLAKVSMQRKLEKLRDFEKIDDYAMPSGFNGELRSYQKAGFNWMNFLSEFNFGGCLADDMGLGKTIQALALLQNQKEKGVKNASLLIVPTSLIYNWKNEAQKFTPDIKVFEYTGTFRDKNIAQFEGYDLVITTYGIVRLDYEILKKYYFNYLILDESQSIKNPSSANAQSVNELACKYKLILTGTPIENSILDLWSQMNFINPGLLGTQSVFKKEFLHPIEKLKDEAKAKKLHALIKPFILRRQKKQVAHELPDKIEQIVQCEMSDAQHKLYESTKAIYRNQILDNIEKEGVSKTQMAILQGLMKLRQLANHPVLADEKYTEGSGKFDSIIEMLENVIQEKHKVLIFSQFVTHLAIVKNHLNQNNIAYCYLDGATKDRQSEVEKFQNDESLQVFLISLKAGGLGLNLTAADYVFILDPWWNPAAEAQAIDRAHRIGQKNTVFIYKFISKDTVEEKILNLQKHKIALSRELITTEESFLKNLSQEDIMNLLD
jgi:SNF2 family DNA or RNA helicase